MADNKEALPVLPASEAYVNTWRIDLMGKACEHLDSANAPYYTADQMRDYATAAISELRAEVELYRHVRNDIEALHQAQTLNNQNYSNHWHEAIDAALEAFDAARAGASGGAG